MYLTCSVYSIILVGCATVQVTWGRGCERRHSESSVSLTHLAPVDICCVQVCLLGTMHVLRVLPLLCQCFTSTPVPVS
jgi:hypothetical protein